MKKIIITFLISLCMVVSCDKIERTIDNIITTEKQDIENNEQKYRVLKVSDGDTITIKAIGKNGALLEPKMKIRFYGIDAPESSQAHGAEATKFLSLLIDGKDIEIDIMEQDQYGRFVANVYIDDIYVNALMIKEGHAWWYEQYAKYDDDFRDLQVEAKKQKKGLWRKKNPMAPWEYRKLKKK